MSAGGIDMPGGGCITAGEVRPGQRRQGEGAQRAVAAGSVAAGSVGGLLQAPASGAGMGKEQGQDHQEH